MNNVMLLLARLRWCAEHSSRRFHVYPPRLAVVHRAVANLLPLSSLRVIVSIQHMRPARASGAARYRRYPAQLRGPPGSDVYAEAARKRRGASHDTAGDPGVPMQASELRYWSGNGSTQAIINETRRCRRLIETSSNAVC